MTYYDGWKINDPGIPPWDIVDLLHSKNIQLKDIEEYLQISNGAVSKVIYRTDKSITISMYISTILDIDFNDIWGDFYEKKKPKSPLTDKILRWIESGVDDKKVLMERLDFNQKQINNQLFKMKAKGLIETFKKIKDECHDERVSFVRLANQTQGSTNSSPE